MMEDDGPNCDACGWTAAFLSMLAFGTFGVPIKSEKAQSVHMDPLVFQSYKTLVCFLTSWLVLFNQEFRYTPWGIVSGLFWVPGGWATVYAIQHAGLAIGIGMGSSFIVLVSFIWGIFVFGEQIHSRWQACFAILCMMTGLMGMAYFSSPSKQQTSVEGRIDQSQAYQTVSSNTSSFDDDDDNDRSEEENRGCPSNNNHYQEDPEDDAGESSPVDAVAVVEETSNEADGLHNSRQTEDSEIPVEIICGQRISKRVLGMLAAMLFTGVWGGSIMAPMKFCNADTKGTHYLLSFSIGASIVCSFFWLVRWLYNAYHYRSFSQGYQALPSFHFRLMWFPAGCCGLLWSIGNYFSLISVYYLGEGVGYPLVQTSIIVAGLWGILYFKEVRGTRRILQWLASSLMTIYGIILLSYEHHAS